MRKRSWQVLDDFDGTPAAETVRFTIDGVDYEIDLSAENAAEWRETVAPWVATARRVPKARAKAKTSGPAAAEVRRWAAEQGIEVKPSGIIPRSVLDQYAARG